MKKLSDYPALLKINSRWMNLRNFTLFSISLFFAWSIYSCKTIEPDQISPVTVNSSPVEGEYAIFVNSPNSDLGIIRRYPKFKIDVAVFGNHDSNGLLTTISSAVIYNPNSKEWVAAGYEKGYPIRITTSNGYLIDLKNYNKTDLTVDITISLNGVTKILTKQKLNPLFFTAIESNTLKGARINALSCETYKKLMAGLGFALSATALTIAIAIPPVGILEGLLLANTAISTANSFSELVTGETLTRKYFNPNTANWIDGVLYTASFLDLKPKPDQTANMIGNILSIPGKTTDFPTGIPLFDPCNPFPPANSTGDPHITTFDGLYFDLQSHGEFIATKSTIDNFEVQIRQEDVNKSGRVTMNTAVAVQTGSDVVYVMVKPDRLFINNQAQNLTSFTSQALKNGASTGKVKEGNYDVINISVKSGDLVKIRFHGSYLLDYSLYPSDTRKGKLIGILGNFDGDKTNDVQTRNGENILINGVLPFAKLYTTYVDSWRITQANSLFYYDAGKNTDSYTQKDFPRTAQTITAEQKLKAEGICRNAGVMNEPFLSNCIVDVAITDDPSVASSSLWGQSVNTFPSDKPVSIIQEAVDVKRITTFGVSSYILKSDGTLWASGWNDHGRFGIGSASFNNANIGLKYVVKKCSC